MSNADRTIWQFPKNVAGKVPGWRSDGKGLENKDWADPATKQDASANLTTLAAVTPGSKGLAILADTSSDAVHEELAKDWSDGTSGAPTLSVPNVMQRRYVDVGAYASLTDTNDAHAAIQAAFDDANGREIVFTNPYGGTRYYRSLTRPSGASATTGALTMPRKARIIMESGALLDFSDWANSGNAKYLLYAKGTEPTAINLSANAAAGDNSITLATGGGASFTAGSWHMLVSDALFTSEDSTLGTKGEWVYVRSISSDTLTLGADLRDSYATADTARLYPMTDLCELLLENMHLLGCGNFSTAVVGDRGIWIENGINCHIRGGSISRSDQLTASLVNVLNGSIDGVRVDFDAKNTDAVNQYGPHLVNMAEACKIINCDISGGKEAIGLTATGGIQGVTRDAFIAHNRMRGAWRSGFATHDTHTNILFEGNIIDSCEQGVDNRIVGGTYRGNIIRNLGTDGGTLSCGFQIGSGAAKLVIEGNIIDNAVRGVLRASSVVDETTTGAVGDISIINNTMRNIGTHGIRYNVSTTDDEFSRGALAIVGNDITLATTGTPVGIEVEGKWAKPVVAQNTLRGGNGGRSIYLHNTSAGGTNGPISPSIVGNRYENYTEPLIQHSTGKWTIEGNVDIDATALPSLASASALTIPTTGNVYSVTGTTTINTILRAAEYVGKTIILMFSASLTVTNNANAGAANDIQLSGAANFAATANDQLMLVSNGTVWREVSRTAI